MVGQLAKTAIFGVMGACAPMIWQFRRGPGLLILTYHRILPDGHPARAYEQPGMIASPEALEANIRALRKDFELVHIDDWLLALDASKRLPRRACAITFDDGWSDNYTHAFPILRREAAPATVYLVSSRVGQQYGFWPTVVARLLVAAWQRGDQRAVRMLASMCPDVDIPESVRRGAELHAADRVIMALKRRHTDTHMSSVLESGKLGFTPASEPELLTWQQAREMSGSGLVKFGSHSRTHLRLRDDVPEEILIREIRDSGREIEENLGVPVHGFCYPNGDLGHRSVAMVEGCYRYGVTTSYGWNGRARRRALLARVTMHDGVCARNSRFRARIATGL